MLSSEPGLGLRFSQNFSTNSARSAPPVNPLQAALSSDVMIHFTGPSAHRSSGCSPMLGGALNRSNPWKNGEEPSDAAPLFAVSTAPVLPAASKAATAFFEYVALSIVEPGFSCRKVTKSASAFSARPRLASQTPR